MFGNLSKRGLQKKGWRVEGGGWKVEGVSQLTLHRPLKLVRGWMQDTQDPARRIHDLLIKSQRST